MSSSQPAVLAPAERLPALRAQLKRQGLDGFVIPLADEHQGEYVPERAQRLRWLTGFSGSAGVAVVLGESAAIFVDGRYTLQAEAEVDGALFARHHSGTQTPEDWIGGHLGAGMTLGYDAWLHTPNAVKRLRDACAKAGGNLQACAANPIDAVWSDQPPPPRAPVVGHDLEFAGVSAEEKRRSVAANLDGASACVLSARIRLRGCSMCAAATCRILHFRYHSRSFAPTDQSTGSSIRARRHRNWCAMSVRT